MRPNASSTRERRSTPSTHRGSNTSRLSARPLVDRGHMSRPYFHPCSALFYRQSEPRKSKARARLRCQARPRIEYVRVFRWGNGHRSSPARQGVSPRPSRRGSSRGHEREPNAALCGRLALPAEGDCLPESPGLGWAGLNTLNLELQWCSLRRWADRDRRY